MSEDRLAYRYIVFEGGEGSGKTTVIERLKREAEFADAAFTREPGGTEIGERLRSILKDPKLRPTVWTELFILMAGRAQQIPEIFQTALAADRFIIADRSFLSTYAYQWHRLFGEQEADEFFRLVRRVGLPRPGLVLWFDIDPAAALARRPNAGLTDRFDGQDLSFHQSVRDGYRHLFTAIDPWAGITERIDAARSPEEVYTDVVSALHRHLQGGKR